MLKKIIQHFMVNQAKFSAKQAIKAFPDSLQKDILSLFDKISLQNNDYHSETILMILQGKSLEIPYRIYFEAEHNHELTQTENLILNCLLTRHHNGFIRQKSLELILSANEIWIIPFVFQLLGEYVIQILEVVKEILSEELLSNFVRFIKENPSFFEKTEQRIISYWNCYYRGKFPKKEDYVGFQILEAIKTHK
ncbi:MAG: hypothetical protein K1X72_06100 [Pyrinomonadaceae bacterium]|nr:hypothetical protein [Pyrinomonadaceae bacterium]